MLLNDWQKKERKEKRREVVCKQEDIRKRNQSNSVEKEKMANIQLENKNKQEQWPLNLLCSISERLVYY